VDEAVRTYRNHLAVSPYRGREDGLERLRFADRLAELGREREAAQMYEALWEATREERRTERCMLFKSVDLARYERTAPALVARLRELRPACTDMGRMERAVEHQEQGRDEAAIRELEQQLVENPMPVEPYLALERLYLKEGRVEDAARVVTRYLQREQDARERCRLYRTLSPRTVRAMNPALVEELERACRSPGR
jgi:thioredoxin-like negative regulator of GroEL